MAHSLFHTGNRELQDRFHSRKIADRLETFARATFTDADRLFIEGATYFFLATADAAGRPDCNFKGGPEGFVRVTGPDELAFPDYDGNGMFKSLGNVLVNPRVGMLFINMHGQPRRLRVNGQASINPQDPLLAETIGAQMIVRVIASAIFANCPRYIPTMTLVAPSRFIPKSGEDPVEPEWKSFDDFKDVIHPRQKTWQG